jgi:organic hydroperoxide reductase OsmC/OhrA
MASMTVELSNIAGTEAALGWAGGHTLVVDRPEGRAGGKGLGFNGGQLLALTIGGCFATTSATPRTRTGSRWAGSGSA